MFYEKASCAAEPDAEKMRRKSESMQRDSVEWH